MSLAYVDSSCIVANAFGEAGASAIVKRWRGFTHLASSTLLEAELFSALTRERRELTDQFHAHVALIAPDRTLSEELAIVFEAGHVRGADSWHLATALYLSPDASQLTFLTLDLAQRKVAKALGFQV